MTSENGEVERKLKGEGREEKRRGKERGLEGWGGGEEERRGVLRGGKGEKRKGDGFGGVGRRRRRKERGLER